MLSRVVVQSETPLYLELENARPSDPIIVDKIDGLDPPDIDLFLGDYARDGGWYSGRRVGKRNPVFALTLNPDPDHENPENHTVANIRERLYRAFIDPRRVGDDVRVDLIDDEKPPRYLSGFTEKLESGIFSKETEMTISMICPNPYIYNVDETVKDSNGPTVLFPYEGTAETGVEVYLTITSNTPVVSVKINDGIPITLNFAFQTGDLIYINTRRGERKIRLTRGGVDSNILYSMTADSRWLELHRVVPIPISNPLGLSTMVVYGSSLSNSIANITKIKSRGAWWGI